MFSIICYILSMFVFLSIILFEMKSKSKSLILIVITLYLVLIYIVAPISVFEFGLGVSKNFIGLNIDRFNEYISLIVLLFSLCFFVGARISIPCFLKFKFCFDDRKNHSQLVFFLFIIVLFSFSLFVYFYGGFDYVMANISRIRSGVDENKSYLGAFFKLFTYYIEIVVFYTFSYYLLVKKYRNNNILLLFILTFVLAFAIFKSFVDGGRGGLINLFIGLIVSYYYIRNKLPKTFLVFSVPTMVFVGLFGKIIVSSYSDNVEIDFFEHFDSVYGAIISEYSHQVLSIGVTVRDEVFGERALFDFVAPLLKPLRLFGVDGIDSVSYYNTYLIKGEWDSEVPPGIIQFMILQGSLIVFPIFSLTLGFVVKVLDRVISCTLSDLSCSLDTQAFVVSSSAIFLIYFPFSIINADLALFIQWCFAYLILYILLYCFRYFLLVKT